jgi:hypothetical protein
MAGSSRSWRDSAVLAALVTTLGLVVIAVLNRQSAPRSQPDSAPPVSQPAPPGAFELSAGMRQHIALLESRAAEISRELDRQKRPKERLAFRNLHRQNIDALQQGDLNTSRDLSARINRLLAGAGLSYPASPP